MEEILSVHNLHLVYGKNKNATVAINNVSLNIYKGEILVVMGLSGSGKSSLLRSLNGIHRRKEKHAQCSGEVYIHNSLVKKEKVSLLDCSPSILRKIRQSHMSMVFQDFALMPWRTALENVCYPLEIQHVKTSERLTKSQEKLDLVGLSSWSQKFPHELSGGMKQRVGLARALVTNADILFMDEPFSALDPMHKKHLQDEILHLQRSLKKTIVFVTHDIHEAFRIADRLAIMDAGKILQLGTPGEIMQNPSCDKVKQFCES